MTREEASSLVVEFFKAYNTAHPGISEKGFAAGMFGAAELFFSYQERDGNLDCFALIYRFRNEPKVNVLTALERASHEYDTGGGELKYLTDNRSLFLKRVYSHTVSETQFINDTKRLAEASMLWASEVIERVATEAFQHED